MNNKQPKQLTEIAVIKLKKLIDVLESPAVTEKEKQIMETAQQVKDKSITTIKNVSAAAKDYVIDFMNDEEKQKKLESKIKTVCDVLDMHVY